MSQSNSRLLYLRLVYLSFLLTPCIFGLLSVLSVMVSTALIVALNLLPVALHILLMVARTRTSHKRDIRKSSGHMPLRLALILYALLTLYSLWTANFEVQTYTRLVVMPIIIALFLNVFIFVFSKPSRNEIMLCIRAALSAAPVFAIVSLLVDAASGNVPDIVSSASSGERLLSTAFFSGPNSAAIFYGFALVCAAAALRARLSLFLLAAIAVSGLYLLATQSRGMTFVTLFCVGFIVLRPALQKMTAVSLCALWPVSAIVLSLLYAGIDDTLLGDILTRSEGREFGVASGRPMVWESAFQIIHADIRSFVFGLGFSNGAQTELASTLGFLFNSFSATELMRLSHGPHNAALQIVFDIGIVGLIVYFFVLCVVIQRVIQSNLLRLLPVIVYGLVTGYNEAVGTIYQPIVFLAFTVIFILCAHLPEAVEVKTSERSKPRMGFVLRESLRR